VNTAVEELLEQLRASIKSARSMPMSSSAVIHRADVLAQIDAIEAALPQAFAESDKVYSQRDRLVAEAQEQADRIVVEARNEHERLVSDSEVYRVAKHEADEERLKAARESEALRKETDEYVDGRLANLEITLTKTLKAVTRGRDKIHGRSELDRLDDLDDDDTGSFIFPGRHSGSADSSI
jgi:cell division septum initiation protein DivIVA